MTKQDDLVPPVEVEALRRRVTELEHAALAHQRAKQAFSVREKHLESFLDSVGLGLVIRSVDGRFSRVSRAFCDFLGYSEKELLDTQCSSVSHPEDIECIENYHVPRLLSGETSTLQGENRFIHKQGHVVWTHLSILLVRNPTGAPQHFIALIQDITERKLGELDRVRLLSEVCAAREALQQLSNRLVQAQESERRRIALELHDQIGQALTGLKLRLESLSIRHAGALGPSLQDMSGELSELIQKVRELSLDLRPAMLDDLGLIPAILWHLERYSAQTGIDVSLEQLGVERRFPPGVETAAYRIVQESLTNVARHARTARAVVRLWSDAETLSVQVEDHGAGFDRTVPRLSTRSSGLLGMEERALMLDGQLTIESMPGRGTRVIAELPLGGKSASEPA